MARGRTTAPDRPVGPGTLVEGVLEAEAVRQREQRARSQADRPISDELLAGVGGESISLAAAARRGGVGALGLLCTLPLLDAAQGSAYGVVAPDIQSTLHLTLTKVGVIGSLGALMVLVAAVPLGRLADTYARFPIVGVCTLMVAIFTALSGLAHTAWQLVAATVGAGLGKGNEGPVQGSLVADAFPIQARTRIFAMIRGSQGLGFVVGPAFVGGAASLAGGSQGWRWPFLLLAVPAAVAGLAAFRLPEPRRGSQEMQAVLGEELPVPEAEPAIPIRAGFARLKKVQTFNFFIMAVAVLGFALIAVPIYAGIFLQHSYHLTAGARGVVGSLGAIGTLLGVAVGGIYGDRLFRRTPTAAVRLAALFIFGSGLFSSASFLMPGPVPYTVLAALAGASTMGGFVAIQGCIAAVIPYRLRATGMAMIFLYLSLFGGLLGTVLVAQIAAHSSIRTALSVVAVLAGSAGAVLLGLGSRFVLKDMASASADLMEEQEELRRSGERDVPYLLQVRNLDFSYGAVQVLFDVNLDVAAGEVLALLGTNGAGKSTVLRNITGLSQPDRGVVRLGGKTITFSDPGVRLSLGLVHLPGGKATFPTLTVLDNLRARGFTVPSDRFEHRLAEVLDLFPVLRERLDQPAGTLSGGEQQMLAIAGALLLDPKVLLIDELSLGLAPVMVQQLLEVIGTLKKRGLTMVIVEQSINVALSIADRAVFMEKGQVRFEGPARELLERDDLVRAVFLGATGG